MATLCGTEHAFVVSDLCSPLRGRQTTHIYLLVSDCDDMVSEAKVGYYINSPACFKGGRSTTVTQYQTQFQ